jgi:putative ABC transport system permease protein
MLVNYLKVAAKVLLRRRFFTFISLFGVSVTLLVVLVATAILDQLFAPVAPEIHSDRTLWLYQISAIGKGWVRGGPPGYAFLEETVRPLAKLPGVERVAVLANDRTVVSYLNGRRIELQLKRTDPEVWRILDFHFLEGGPLTAADEEAGRAVAVINEATRSRFFGGGKALGKSLDLEGRPFRVVGVVPNVPALRVIPYSDVWVPLSATASSSFRHETFGSLMALVLARSRADFPTIQAEFARRLRRATLPDPHVFDHYAGGLDTIFGTASRLLFSPRMEESHPGLLRAVLAALLLLFLLLPTVNLINVNLSRILERASEIGVRRSFGASSWTLVGQFLVENLVLTLLGAGVGLALTAAALPILNDSGLLPYARLEINLRVFFVGLGIALLFGVLSGVYPAWRMSRLHPVQALSGRNV